MSDEKNPYPNREHAVGALAYHQPHANKDSIASVSSMLEYGEPELIYDLPRLVDGGSIANLGHARGGSAMLMASSLRDYDMAGNILSVDAFNFSTREFGGEDQRLKDRKLNAYIDLRMGTTEFWGTHLSKSGTLFRLVFVDANHRYAGVKIDVEVWSPMVQTGGLLAFHDTNQEDTHRVLREEILDSAKWRERNELHVNRIRVFERV